ncbi:hypothetical protein PUNSTDRAFT_131194 [Punctularia strigosozonata HHB-11173 SS5]|uniref:uncharacterized protein n=1 Tax=Punctularia strigosozonata (strain HHB-11173) TaxID=741275 RepID=UPI0004417328|nr:uncharacterized protein PUNSTDRAFT_131194 [Punctularia strigosozonata HHB-11173 SS5]EIN12964.1 hypothetical protein PUNSTDRAFT_131194 [Punctularia strigosozonata HHB-11173 SS5]
MMFSKSFASLTLLVAAACVSAAPVINKKTMVMNNSVGLKGNSAGAAYFITNEPSGNFVVSADIHSDGTLTLARAVSADGRGEHGNDAPAATGPDGLFSQASVKASQNGKVLATVNPGSNTVAIFAINAKNPSIINMIGKPVSTEGEFPMSLALNEAGNKLCVLNGGQVNGVNCYKVDPKNGLQAIGGTLRSLGLNQTTPATGPAGTTSQLLFSSDEKSLIASVKGVPPQPGFLAVWSVNGDDSLSPDFTKVAPAAGGLLPFSMTPIPGKNALLVTDPGLGFDVFDLSNVQSGGNSQSAINATGASSANPISGQSATCWSSFSTKTGNFYLTDIGTAMVTEVNVDSNLNSTIVKQYAQKASSGTIDNAIATVNGKDFLYVLGANATQINVLSLDAPGQARGIQTLDIAGPSKNAGLTVNPFNLQGMTTFIKN